MPVTGLPITIGRSYDSLERNRVGDFGYGWSLAIGRPRLEVAPDKDVTLTLPDGRRHSFAFTPQPLPFWGFLLSPAYTPVAGGQFGVYGRLEASGCTLLVAAGNGRCVCFFDTDYQPTAYKYTDPYGRVYLLSPDGSLQSITDLSGNVLTFTPGGISSSAGGLNVQFQRDGQGRITRITDSLGKVYNYSYAADPANGCPADNLCAVTYPTVPNETGTGNTTPVVKYSYDSSHRFTGAKDPRGNTAATTTYDANGRLQSVTDALGNQTSYGYDVTASGTTTTVTEQAQRPSAEQVVSVLTTDSFGKLLSQTLNDTDPALRRTYTYSYDAAHNLRTVTEPAVSVVQPDGTTAIVSPVTTYFYDVNGRRTKVQDPLGHYTCATYNAYGGPLTLTDPSASDTCAGAPTRTVHYDDAANQNSLPTSVTDSLGTLGGYSWDSRGRPQTRTDGNGKPTSFTYDPYGNVLTEAVQLTSPPTATSATTRYTYDTLGRKLSATDPLGTGATDLSHTTSYTYDDLGRVLTATGPYPISGQTTPGRPVTTYRYDANGNLKTVTDALGRVTTYSYDNANRLTQTTYPAVRNAANTAGVQYTVATGYDWRGNPVDVVRMMDPATNQRQVTHYSYDKAGWQTGVTTVVTTAADPLIDPNRVTTGTAYDLLGRTLSATDGRGKTTTYAYDAAGRQHFLTDARGAKTQYDYDDRGRLTTITYPNPATGQLDSTAAVTTVQQTYDGAGRVKTRTDQNGKVTTYNYFDDGQLYQVQMPYGSGQTATTTYAYDLARRLTSLTDAKSHVTSFSYDNLGRLTQKTWPQVGSNPVTFEQYGYDAVGNRTSHTLARAAGDPAQTNISGYDALNRLSSITYYAGSSTPSVGYIYIATGQRARMTDVRGVNFYTYDAQDRLTTIGLQGESSNRITYAYDANGNRTRMTVRGQGDTTYSYDDANRLTSVTAPTVGTTTYQYDANGNRTQRIQPTTSTITADYTYDYLNRLTGILYTRQNYGEIARYYYTLNKVGYRTHVEEWGGRSIQWAYDDGDRLTRETWCAVTTNPCPAANITSETGFGYDAVGNRASTQPRGGAAVTATYNELDQLTGLSTGQTYAYDKRGNLTSGDGVTLTWDAAARLRTAALAVGGTGHTLTYAYGADGRRLQQTDTVGGASTVTSFLWDEASAYGDVVQETTGAATTSYTFGGPEPIAEAVGTTPYYFLQDGAGSIRALANAGSWSPDGWAWDAFGTLPARTGASPVPYGYAGRDGDALTGYQYLRARSYAPARARFLSRDPAGYDLQDPVELDRYVYAQDNPINYSDPIGYESLITYTQRGVAAIEQRIVMGEYFVKKALLDPVLVKLLGWGTVLATHAKSYYDVLEKNELGRTTVATSVIRVGYRAVEVVSINKSAGAKVFAKIAQEVRANNGMFVPQAWLNKYEHAEVALYEYIVFLEQNFSDIKGSNIIGVSHYTGPCPTCQNFFNAVGLLKDVTIYYWTRYV